MRRLAVGAILALVVALSGCTEYPETGWCDPGHARAPGDSELACVTQILGGQPNIVAGEPGVLAAKFLPPSPDRAACVETGKTISWFPQQVDAWTLWIWGCHYIVNGTKWYQG